MKLLNLDECAKTLDFQKDNYDTNVNIIMLELITTEDSDNYDQEGNLTLLGNRSDGVEESAICSRPHPYG